MVDARLRLQKLVAFRADKPPAAADPGGTASPAIEAAPSKPPLPATAPAEPRAGPEPTKVAHAAVGAPAGSEGIAWTVAAGSAAVAITGAVLMYQGKFDSDAAKTLTVHSKSDYAAYETAYDAASMRWNLGAGLAAAGLVGAGVGIWLLLRPAKPSAQALAPILLPDGVGLAWSGRW